MAEKDDYLLDLLVDLGFTNAGEVAKARAEAGSANVSVVDSVGIGAFVSVWASARKSGCELKFINLNDDIHDLFEITRLHGLFAGDAPGA